MRYGSFSATPTLDELLALDVRDTRHHKPVIALAYIDAGSHVQLDALAPPLMRAFDAEVVLAADMRLPSAAWNAARQQYCATTILDALASHKQPEWHRLLGITSVDLFAPGLNFVSGEADPGRGIAVFSLARLIDTRHCERRRAPCAR